MSSLRPFPDSSSKHQLSTIVSSSALPYLFTLVAGVLVARFSSYILREGPLIKAQPPTIYISYIFFALAIILWLLYKGKRSRVLALNIVYLLIVIFLFVRIALTYVHEDNYNHLVWLYPVLLLMLYLKAPSWEEIWASLQFLAVLIAIVMVISYFSELIGFVEPFAKNESRIEFERTSYWLPLDGFIGVDGRWTGPFTHNRTGLAAAFVLIIVSAKWTRWSYFLVPIGVFFTLITFVRGSLLALLAGFGVLILFSSLPVIRRIPKAVRWLIVAIGVGSVFIFYVFSGTGLTGRDQIWSGYLDQWRTSPILGVGQYDLDVGNDGTIEFVDAHNLFIDELSRNGVIGLVGLLLVIFLSVAIMIRAANRGFAGPLAIMSVYIVGSSSDLQADLIHMGLISMLVVLATASAGTFNQAQDINREPVHAGLPA